MPKISIMLQFSDRDYQEFVKRSEKEIVEAVDEKTGSIAVINKYTSAEDYIEAIVINALVSQVPQRTSGEDVQQIKEQIELLNNQLQLSVEVKAEIVAEV